MRLLGAVGGNDAGAGRHLARNRRAGVAHHNPAGRLDDRCIARPVGDLTDGAFVQTLPHPQVSTEAANTGSGGCGPASNCDSRVVTSYTVPATGNGGGSEVITPRAGTYLMRSTVYQTEQPRVSGTPCVFDGTTCKNYVNVSNGAIRNEWSSGLSVYDIEYDTEGYLGFSIFVPSNWEIETGAPFKSATTRMLFEAGTSQSRHLFVLALRTVGTATHWEVEVPNCATSISDCNTITYDLGTVAGDLGVWTDFVVRFRSNPCETGGGCDFVALGVSGAASGTWPANTGIFQMWKAGGTPDINGDRTMSQVVNRLNTGVGVVPQDELIDFHLKLYAFGWGKQTTDVAGPITIGFDEYRWGEVVRDGTGYSDVHPTQLACTDSCP